MERVRTTLVYVLLTLVTAVALFPIGYMLLIAGGEGERFAEWRDLGELRHLL